MKQVIHPCMGVSTSLPEALTQATAAANAYLSTHQWQDSDGHTAYTVVPLVHFDGTYYTYVLHLIGPDEETQ